MKKINFNKIALCVICLFTITFSFLTIWYDNKAYQEFLLQSATWIKSGKLAELFNKLFIFSLHFIIFPILYKYRTSLKTLLFVNFNVLILLLINSLITVGFSAQRFKIAPKLMEVFSLEISVNTLCIAILLLYEIRVRINDKKQNSDNNDGK